MFSRLTLVALCSALVAAPVGSANTTQFVSMTFAERSIRALPVPTFLMSHVGQAR
jgi:hypothetical protein